MSEVVQSLLESFDATHQGLSGAHESWVRVLRRNAMQRVENRGFPTTRDESWKYTDVARYLDRLASRQDVSDADRVELNPEDLEQFDVGLSHRIVLVDGVLDQGLSSLETLPVGVRVETLSSMLRQEPDEIEAHLHAHHLSGAFAALNCAMMEQGVYLNVPGGIVVEKPIHLLSVSTGSVISPRHVRNLIVCGEYAQVTVIEHEIALGDSAAFINAVTDVESYAGSRIEHYMLQQCGKDEVSISSVRVHQHRDSYYHSLSATFGAALCRRDIHVEMNGEGAECALNGLYLAGGRQHVDHHTRIDHLRPNCRSRESYKGIVDGRARAVFNGKVVVHNGADQTDSAQSNANLLLSDKAEIDTKPDLEIFADDVKCAHGATVGQLDSNQLFYLRSRGLSEEEARHVLMFAFADEVLATVKVPELRSYLERAAFEKLPQVSELEGLLGE
jgi:Fe-S cluster assembly protein SufD